MGYQSSFFLAWQQAERCAREAERRMSSRVCRTPGESPDADEVALVRALRDHARMLMKQMLEEMGEQAELLKFRRDAPFPLRQPAQETTRESRT